MIKATGGTKDGTPLLVLGLSRENTKRLHEGKPILVRADEIDPRLPRIAVWLVAGETEDEIAAELGQLVSEVDR